MSILLVMHKQDSLSRLISQSLPVNKVKSELSIKNKCAYVLICKASLIENLQPSSLHWVSKSNLEELFPFVLSLSNSQSISFIICKVNSHHII